MLKLALRIGHTFFWACVIVVALYVGLCVTVLLLAIAVPGLVRPRASSRPKVCQANLKQIDNATEQYLMDRKTTRYPKLSDLSPTYFKVPLSCPSGGTYTIGSASANPKCSIGGTQGDYNAHALP
jgi:competence protein ComGC